VDKLIGRVKHVALQRLKPAAWENQGFFDSLALAKIVMVTGGEPMLRQNTRAFQEVMEGIRAAGLKVHIESNGTLPPNEWARKNVDFFDLSPKYQLYPEKYTKEIIKAWVDCGVQVAWKFVVGTPDDIFTLARFLETMNVPRDADIWLMPLTTDTLDMGWAMDILTAGNKAGPFPGVEAFKTAGYKNVRVSPRLQVTGKFY
jgi:organic radical activating enzyme